MTIQEAQTVLKAEGWTYLPRLRKGHSYIYAQRKVHGKKLERYICSLTTLASITVDEISVRLNRSAMVRPAKCGSSDQALTND